MAARHLTRADDSHGASLPAFFVRCIVVSVLATLLLELVVFNYRHWESLSFAPVANYEVTASEGLLPGDDNSYTVAEDGEAYFEVTGIDQRIRNVCLDLFPADQPSDSVRAINVGLSMIDAANSHYYALPQTEVVSSVPESKYIRLYPVGDTKSIRIDVLESPGRVVSLTSLDLNARAPFRVLPYRILVCFTVLLSLLVFRPKSPIYEVDFQIKDPGHLLFCLVSILVDIALVVAIAYVFKNPYREQGDHRDTYLQYNYLAESILDGRLDLEIDPPAALAQLDNPYDPSARSQALEQTGETAIMDAAYFEGRYYCYFGVVPAVLFYLPWQLLTGAYLSTTRLIVALSALLVPALFLFHHCLVSRFRFKTSLGAFLIISHMLVFSCGLLYFVQISSLYSLPFLCGLLFDALGLSCWLVASRDETPRRSLLVVGAILIALVMGCRPQLSLAFLFAFPLFWDHIKRGLFFTVKGAANTMCVIGPFLVVGFALMGYNFARFGSPLDFGATYNLTGFDMTSRGFVPQRFLLGIWEYFFQPLRIGAKFPYFEVVARQLQLQHDFQGQVINEPIIGGFLFLCPVGAWLCFLRTAFAAGKDRDVAAFASVAIALALFAVAMDIQMVGITYRYFAEFSLFLLTAAVLSWYSLMAGRTGDSAVIIRGAMVTLCLLGISLQLLTLMTSGRANELQACNPAVYWAIKYQLLPFLSIR